MSFPATSNVRAIEFTRRQLLQRFGAGCGSLAFAALAYSTFAGRELSADSLPAPTPLAPKPPHHKAKAKRILFLMMRGGPSHVDTFDPKPRLTRDDGQPGPRPGSKLLASKWRFQKHGRSGLEISELFPELARHADRMCVVRSMQTDLPAHPQAFIKMHTGTSQFVRPSLGAWMLYGLGTLNANLPGFVSITPPSGFGGTTNYGSSFLPAIYQGTRLGSDGRPIARAEIANLRPRVAPAVQRAELDFVQSLNQEKLELDQRQPDVEGAIQSFELAFRMQKEMPEVADLSRETAATQTLYGIGGEATDDMGRKCLLARRLLEAGVRFVEITHGNWDHHFNLNSSLETSAREVDRPIAGLLQDLAARGLLDETLVVWTGEFGRTPYAEGPEGRDHNIKAFSAWLAGGGVRGGHVVGRSDDYGYEAVDTPVPIHDWHATLLAALGLEHTRLTFRHSGREFRLTDVKGHVVDGIFS